MFLSTRYCLLDRHRFGQVAGFVDVATAGQRDREHHLTAEKEAVVVMGILVGNCGDVLVLFEYFTHQVRQGFECFDDVGAIAKAQVAHSAEVQGDQCREHHLGGEGLGRCDANFRSRMLVDAAITLAGNRRANAVVDRQGAVAFSFRLAQGRERIDCFAGLADGKPGPISLKLIEAYRQKVRSEGTLF